MEVAGQTFWRLDLRHPRVEARIVEEIHAGVDVYYDRLWPLSLRLCRLLLARPELARGRDVLVVGAGVGLEAVVAGRLCARLRVNDRAPVALDLLGRQLRENGVRDFVRVPGSFADAPLDSGLDLVVGCLTVYDEDTAGAMRRLVRRCGRAGVPLLLADRNIGGHFSRILDGSGQSVQLLDRTEAARIVRVGEPPIPEGPTADRRP